MSDHRAEQAGTSTAVRSHDGDDLFHRTCCFDDDIALCGADVSDLPFTDGDGETWCALCHEVDETDDPFCPRFGTCYG